MKSGNQTFKQLWMRWFGAVSFFSPILWGPGMQTRKVDLAAWLPNPSGWEEQKVSLRCSRAGFVFQWDTHDMASLTRDIQGLTWGHPSTQFLHSWATRRLV